MSDEDTRVDESGKFEGPVQMCKCPRKVHPSCLKQWQRVKLGTEEETNCKFCGASLPDAFDSRAVRRFKCGLFCLDALETLLIVSFAAGSCAAGPLMIVMYQYSTENHPCHSQAVCLYIGFILTFLPCFCLAFFCQCSRSLRPRLMDKMRDLGIEVDGTFDIDDPV